MKRHREEKKIAFPVLPLLLLGGVVVEETVVAAMLVVAVVGALAAFDTSDVLDGLDDKCRGFGGGGTLK